MLNWGLWYIHLFISTTAIAGMVVAYNRDWTYAFRGNLDKDVRLHHHARAMLTAGPIMLALILELAAYADPINWQLYVNLELFALAYPLLDEEIGRGEFWIRAGAYATFWVWQHQFYSWYVWLCGGLVLLSFFAIRYWQEQVHYQWWANTMLAFFLAYTFWSPLARMPLGAEFGPIVTFLIMNLMVFIYWSGIHQQDLRSQKLETRANFDALTNAKSFALFRSDADQLFARARAEHLPLTMVMLDIDHFKSINDRYGHLAGNAVLIGVATLLDKILRDSVGGGGHQIYRTGGEEFNIIFLGRTPAEVQPIVESCWRGVRQAKFSYEKHQVGVTISLGVAGIEDTDDDASVLYKRADDNLYQSKRSGRDTITIDGKTLRVNERPVGGVTYSFFTQPIIDINDKHVLRNELLLRMYDVQRQEWLLPEHFDVSSATQIDLMTRVLAQVSVHSISINLTREQFASEQVAEAMINFAHTNPHLVKLTVEVTRLPTADVTKQMCKMYHAGGVDVAIDDVGDANKWLAVREVIDDVDCIKMTLRLIARQYTDKQVLASVKFWYALAREHDKLFTLEGVENAADEQIAITTGVTRLQGFYYGRPVMPQFN
ncbi:sensor domain-containing diguanylate cyclase [Lacticaseibacillus zhaodongensis]|uniref:sensor domain-containing diguanylate cyclase n=1 Tax=Lacticaseibacillus zhaodongensis TaxID=2668065 RepID=UPI0012D2C5B7|nr:diguanylate cyclase [Lacticaseibacillus zhaodongensis]